MFNDGTWQGTLNGIQVKLMVEGEGEEEGEALEKSIAKAGNFKHLRLNIADVWVTYLEYYRLVIQKQTKTYYIVFDFISLFYQKSEHRTKKHALKIIF